MTVPIEIVQPTCPGCGAAPLHGIVLGGGTQAFCPTDECETWTWNPSQPGGGRKYEMVPEYSDDRRSVTWRPVPLDGEAEVSDVEG